MKNFIKLLKIIWLLSSSNLIFSSVKEQPNIDGMMRAYLHNTILESTVPEYKYFNNMLREIFLTKDENKKIALIEYILSFANKLINKLNTQLKDNATTTGQKKTIETVLYLINEKLKGIKTKLIRKN